MMNGRQIDKVLAKVAAAVSKENLGEGVHSVRFEGSDYMVEMTLYIENYKMFNEASGIWTKNSVVYDVEVAAIYLFDGEDEIEISEDETNDMVQRLAYTLKR